MGHTAPDTEQGIAVAAANTKDEGKPGNGEGLARYPAFKPYRGKPAVRNFRRWRRSASFEARSPPLPYPTVQARVGQLGLENTMRYPWRPRQNGKDT